MSERSVEDNVIGLTYISVAVTGVPTRNLANRKLKIREVDPNGATYSGYSCQGKVDFIAVKREGRTGSHIFEGKG
jgi:hypothetical protein